MTKPRSTPLRAGFASSVVPGAGQLLAGARGFGWTLVLSTIAAATLAAWGVLTTEPTGMLKIATNPDLLLVLVSINLIFGMFRILAVTDAWRRAGGHFVRAGLAALVVFTVVPHATLAYVGLETRSTIMEVFPGGGPDFSPIQISTTSSTSTTTTTLAWAGPIVTPWTIPTSSTTSSTTTTTTLPLGTNRLTFLLLGGDAGPGRSGLRTDSVMVATIDTVTGSAALFGLPRNMAGLSFSDGTAFPGHSQGILNEVYLYGRAHPEMFAGPDPGITAVSNIVSATLGIPIDYHILVEMQGFVEIVDVFGGVNVNPRKAFTAPIYDDDPGDYEMVTFNAGEQRLTGAQALAYARSRTASNDYVRMERQRCLMTGLLAESGPYNLTTKLVSLLDVIERRVSTNIPSNQLPYLINFAPSIDTTQVTFVGFDVDYRNGQYTATGYPMADIPRIQETVGLILAGAWDEEPVNVSLSEDVCG
ncbi:MAG: LCP family protein [Acidimicrobiia bacterium]